MSTTAKNPVLKPFFVMTVAICLFLLALPVSAAAPPQPVWPGPSPEQWYWYEPETDLPSERVDAVFKEAAAAGASFLYSKYPNSFFTAQDIQLESRKSGGQTVESIRIKTSWAGINSASGTRGSYTCLTPLDAFRQVSLYYNPGATAGQWLLRITLVDSSFVFFFKAEAAARGFGNALASALARKDLRLKLPKLGTITNDLTPAQAEALGMTRIESVLVVSVAFDGPADQSGLLPLDVITEINGVRIRNNPHFISLIEGLAPGAKASLACLRREKVVENEKEKFVWNPRMVEVTAR